MEKRNKAAILALDKAYPGVILGNKAVGQKAVFYPMLGEWEEIKKKTLEEVEISNNFAIYGTIIMIEEGVMMFTPIDDTIAEVIIHEVINR